MINSSSTSSITAKAAPTCQNETYVANLEARISWLEPWSGTIRQRLLRSDHRWWRTSALDRSWWTSLLLVNKLWKVCSWEISLFCCNAARSTWTRSIKMLEGAILRLFSTARRAARHCRCICRQGRERGRASWGTQQLTAIRERPNTKPEKF